MSIDRSLKIKGALTRHRNVLTRTERVEKLKEEERWSDSNSLLGLPKVAHRKSHAGKKEKTAAEEAALEAGAIPGTAPVAEKPEAGAKKAAAKPETGKKAAEKPAAAKPAAAKPAAAKPAAGKKEKT